MTDIVLRFGFSFLFVGWCVSPPTAFFVEFRLHVLVQDRPLFYFQGLSTSWRGYLYEKICLHSNAQWFFSQSLLSVGSRGLDSAPRPTARKKHEAQQTLIASLKCWLGHILTDLLQSFTCTRGVTDTYFDSYGSSLEHQNTTGRNNSIVWNKWGQWDSSEC